MSVQQAQARFAVIQQEETVNQLLRKTSELSQNQNQEIANRNYYMSQSEKFKNQMNEAGKTRGVWATAINEANARTQANLARQTKRNVTVPNSPVIVEGKSVPYNEAERTMTKYANMHSKALDDQLAMNDLARKAEAKIKQLGEELAIAQSALRIEQGRLELLKAQAQ